MDWKNAARAQLTIIYVKNGIKMGWIGKKRKTRNGIKMGWIGKML
jgi:hypothetical protein